MNNYASENRIIEIKGPGLRNNLQFFNVINNTQKIDSNGIVYLTSGSNFTFSNSIFYENNQTLFYSPSSYLFARDCHINHKYLIGNIANPYTSKQYITNTFQIDHYSTHFCQTIFVPPTPCRSHPDLIFPCTIIRIQNKRKFSMFYPIILSFTFSVV